MTRFVTGLTALAAVAATTVAVRAAAIEREKVIVVDAPDIQKLDKAAGGFLTSEVIGTDVYSNVGKRIGEVEDFAFSGSHLYAVVDIQDSPLERYVDLTDDDMVVIPWNQLRVMDRPQS